VLLFLFIGKLAGVDKKLYKHLESQWNSDFSESVSPDQTHSLNNIISPFGPMDQPSSRRMLFNLIATLNASYPDYDFSFVFHLLSLNLFYLYSVINFLFLM